MITSNIYNTEFNNLIRKKRYNTNILAEGYDNGSGSYQIPIGNGHDFTSSIAKENVFRRLGTVIPTPTKEGYIQMLSSTADAAIVQEGQAYPEDADFFDRATFRSYKIAAISKLGNQFVDDMHFDVEGYLKNEYARRFGRAEEKLCIAGTGIDEPLGLLKTAVVGIMMDSINSLSYDSVIELYLSIKPEYRKNGTWLMNDTTALALRKLKDVNGNYLWRTSDDTILGKKVEISPYMPDIAAGASPIAFGDLSYVWFLERQPLSLKVLSELYANEIATGYAAFERMDCKLIRPEAVALLSIAE